MTVLHYTSLIHLLERSTDGAKSPAGIALPRSSGDGHNGPALRALTWRSFAFWAGSPDDPVHPASVGVLSMWLEPHWCPLHGMGTPGDEASMRGDGAPLDVLRGYTSNADAIRNANCLLHAVWRP
jgi:hypothetical protein